MGPLIDRCIFGNFTSVDKFWINQGAPNSDFWAHEFSKHATCTSTFDVACYGPDYQEHQELVDFYLAAIRAFRMFPTFNMLAAYGIVPSNETTYTLSQLENALIQQTGALPYLGCGNNGTVLEEVWYFNHVSGTVSYSGLCYAHGCQEYSQLGI